MLGKLFNIGPKITPQVIQKPVAVQKPLLKKMVAKAEPKIDAHKAIEKLLTDLQNVNNPKVDSLRKLFLSLENGSDMREVLAFYKQPILAKDKAKKKSKF